MIIPVYTSSTITGENILDNKESYGTNAEKFGV